MWPWIKRWRDWAMHDLWHLYRTGPQSQALAYSFEKAGLTLHNQPIPWNAEAVLVEAQLKLPTQWPAARPTSPCGSPARSRSRPTASAATTPTTAIASSSASRRRARPPPPRCLWKGHTLGQLTLPVIDAATFVAGLRLQLPTLAVRLGEQSVACQTFVATQCKGLVASAILVSPTSLAPLADLGLHVEFKSERDASVFDVPVPLCSSQLAGRQAVLTAVPPKFPRRIGAWTATWKVADQILASHRVRAISHKTFLRSLRVSDTRFVVETKSGVTLRRQPPGPGDAIRVGPCFLVSSREPGMAGLCKLQVHAQIPGAIASPLLLEQALLVTDGPTIFAPGTVDATDLQQVTTFELRHKSELLGVLVALPGADGELHGRRRIQSPDRFRLDADGRGGVERAAGQATGWAEGVRLSWCPFRRCRILSCLDQSGRGDSMTERVRAAPQTLYERDETAWADLTARLVDERRWDKVDADNLSEYLRDIARRDRREVVSRLGVLLTHMLKWDYQQDHRTNSWHGTIRLQAQGTSVAPGKRDVAKPRGRGFRRRLCLGGRPSGGGNRNGAEHVPGGLSVFARTNVG